MGPVQRGLLLAVLASVVSSCASVDSPNLPWAFNAPRADGYAIDLLDVRPAPGTPLTAGDSVEFLAKVKYSLSIANRGTIVLVFEDEKDAQEAPQVTKRVDSPRGAVTLRDRIIVPTHAKELRLFIPLMPDGLLRTTGEVTIRYPIKQR